MFYVANPGDKMGRIANEFYGNELGRLMLPKLIESNAHTLPFYVGMVGDDILLPPYHILYLPEFDITHQFFPWKSMAGHLNGAPEEIRKNIGRLCESGIDPRVAIAIKEAGAGDHKTASQETWERRAKQVDEKHVDLENILRVNEGRKLAEEGLKGGYAKFNFEEAQKNMEGALRAYRNDKNILTKQHLENAYKLLQKKLQIRAYHNIPAGIKRLQKSVLGMTHKRTFIVESFEEVKKLLSIGKNIKYVFSALGHVPYVDKVIDYGLDTVQVYEEYRAGDNWMKGAAEIVGEVTVSGIITAAVGTFLVLTPFGWGALLVGAAADYVGSKVGKEAVDYIWRQEEQNTKLLANSDFNDWSRSVTFV